AGDQLLFETLTTLTALLLMFSVYESSQGHHSSSRRQQVMSLMDTEADKPLHTHKIEQNIYITLVRRFYSKQLPENQTKCNALLIELRNIRSIRTCDVTQRESLLMFPALYEAGDVVPPSLVAEENIVHPSVVGPEGSHGALVPQAELHPCPFGLQRRRQHEPEGESVRLSVAGPGHVLRQQVEVALPTVQTGVHIHGLVKAEVENTDDSPDSGGSREQLDALQLQRLVLKSHLQLVVRSWRSEETRQSLHVEDSRLDTTEGSSPSACVDQVECSVTRHTASGCS
ncbi:putative protein phosphatase 1 regulatory subunit 3A-like, partial [Triplophysa rosa]